MARKNLQRALLEAAERAALVKIAQQVEAGLIGPANSAEVTGYDTKSQAEAPLPETTPTEAATALPTAIAGVLP